MTNKDKSPSGRGVKCEKSLTFQECELAILRSAVDLAGAKMGNRLVNTPEVQDMIRIVEDFIKKKKIHRGIDRAPLHKSQFLQDAGGLQRALEDIAEQRILLKIDDVTG